MKLGEMKCGTSAKIIRTNGPEALQNRLLEMGFIEGSLVEVLFEAPWGSDPIAVRVRGSLVALRRLEANWIEVES